MDAVDIITRDMTGELHVEKKRRGRKKGKGKEL